MFTWKVNSCSFTDVFIAVASNIHNKVSLNVEYFKNSPSLHNIYYFWTTINPLHPNISMHILHTVLYTSLCAGRENLFDNQEVLQLITISFILITLLFDLGVILKGEIRCKLLSGIKGLKKEGY